MKKLLLALGFIAACAPVHADIIQINVPCDPAPDVMNVMIQYKNALLLHGYGTIASKDGKTFKSIGALKHSISDKSSESIIKQFELKLKRPIEARYIKIRAENYGKCPKWHLGSGGTSWLFFDEITIL